jgi:hypothetical protein
VAVNEAATAGRWVSVAEAATELGLPERAIYRRIATQSLRARRDEQGALLVCLDDPAAEGGRRPADEGNGRLALQGERGTGLTTERARALSEFASGLLDPLVTRLSEQETIIREQAEEIGRLRARQDYARETEDRLAPAFTRQLAELAAIREEIERLGSRRRFWPFG